MQLYTGGARHYHTEPQSTAPETVSRHSPAVRRGSVDLNLTDLFLHGTAAFGNSAADAECPEVAESRLTTREDRRNDKLPGD